MAYNACMSFKNKIEYCNEEIQSFQWLLEKISEKYKSDSSFDKKYITENSYINMFLVDNFSFFTSEHMQENIVYDYLNYLFQNNLINKVGDDIFFKKTNLFFYAFNNTMVLIATFLLFYGSYILEFKQAPLKGFLLLGISCIFSIIFFYLLTIEKSVIVNHDKFQRIYRDVKNNHIKFVGNPFKISKFIKYFT